MEITGKNEKESEKLSPNFLPRISAFNTCSSFEIGTPDDSSLAIAVATLLEFRSRVGSLSKCSSRIPDGRLPMPEPDREAR